MESNKSRDIPVEAIHAFWGWFGTVARGLARNLENRALLRELDARVSSLADIVWEVGPGKNAENALVVSPDGSRDLLQVTERIVRLAPAIDGWEFLSARPPRDGILEFSVKSEAGEWMDVDARDWRYVLYRFPDGMFDIIVEENNLVDVSEGARYSAAVIALDGILGERQRLGLFHTIDGVEKLTSDVAGAASRISLLREHVGKSV